MLLSQNPILRAAGFPALPKSMTFKRTARIGLQPSFLNEQEKAKAKICIQYYNYLQTHLEDTELFREVYKTFYLRNTHRGNNHWTEEDYNTYFAKMFSFVSNGDFTNEVNEVAAYLENSLSNGGYQLSFGSKLVHTINANCPIFDSGVTAYLKEFEGVRFGIDKAQKYAQLCQWFDNFRQNDERFNAWINWFNSEFPEYRTISNTKKIDFVLFLGR